MPPQRRGREGKRRRQGKQPGAPGAHLAWSRDPGQIVPLFPRGACPCGRDLAGAADLGVAASHQVVDVPLVTATVTQYDEHAVACACSAAIVASRSSGSARSVPFAARSLALAASSATAPAGASGVPGTPELHQSRPSVGNTTRRASPANPQNTPLR